MRTRHLLFSALHFMTIVLLLGGGALCLSLASSETLRLKGIALLLDSPTHLKGLGIGLIIFSALLFFLNYVLGHRPYLQLEAKRGEVGVEERVIERCAYEYFQSAFLDQEIGAEVAIHGRSMIEILMTLPKTDDTLILEKLEDGLGAVLVAFPGNSYH